MRRSRWVFIRFGAGALGVAGILIACTMPDYAFSTGRLEPGDDDAAMSAVDAARPSEQVDSAKPPDDDPEFEDAGITFDPDAAPPPPETMCNDGGGALVTVGLGKRCYFFTPVVTTCVGACQPYGGRMATFPDLATLDRTVAATERLRRTRRYWIGIRAKNGSSTRKADFHWVTAEPITFDKWKAGEPAGTGICALQDVLFNSANGGTPSWEDEPQNLERVALCERDVDAGTLK